MAQAASRGLYSAANQPGSFRNAPANEYQHMHSRGLLPGAIQLPPDGQPIIAGKDAQTTGGYLRIGQIIRSDLALTGQLRPGDELQFLKITVEEAKQTYNQQVQLLNRISPVTN